MSDTVKLDVEINSSSINNFNKQADDSVAYMEALDKAAKHTSESFVTFNSRSGAAVSHIVDLKAALTAVNSTYDKTSRSIAQVVDNMVDEERLIERKASSFRRLKSPLEELAASQKAWDVASSAGATALKSQELIYGNLVGKLKTYKQALYEAAATQEKLLTGSQIEKFVEQGARLFDRDQQVYDALKARRKKAADEAKEQADLEARNLEISNNISKLLLKKRTDDAAAELDRYNQSVASNMGQLKVLHEKRNADEKAATAARIKNLEMELKEVTALEKAQLALAEATAKQKAALAQKEIARQAALPRSGSTNALGVWVPATPAVTVTSAGKDTEAHLAGQANGLNKLNGGLKNFVLNANDAHSAARGLAAGFGGLFLTWGAMAPLLAGSAISYGFANILKEGAKFQHELMTIQALSEETTTSVNGLGKAAFDMARQGPYGPLEIAKAMKTLSLAGLEAQQVLEAMPTVRVFALAGDTSIDKAADVLTSVGSAYNIKAANYLYISDVIAKTAAISKASIEGMSESFRTASTVFSQYGVSLEETAKGLALLNNIGVDRSAAGTSLRNFYTDLSARSEKAAAAFEKLGVKAFDSQGRVRGFSTVMLELSTALQNFEGGEQTKLIDAISSERGGKLVHATFNAMKAKADEAGLSLVDYNNKLAKLSADIADFAGFSAIAAAQMMLTPVNQAKSVIASLQATLAQAFTTIEPQFLALTNSLRAVFDSDAFRSGVADVASTFMTLIKYAVEYSKAILNVVIAYQALKGAASAALSLAAAQTAFSGIAGAATAAATGVTASTGAVAAFSRVASFLNPVLAAITTLLTVGAAAWALWKLNFSSAKEEQKAYVGSDHEAFIKALEDEADRLEKVNKARLEGLSLQAYEGQLKLQQLRETPEELVKARTRLAELKDAAGISDVPSNTRYMDQVEHIGREADDIKKAQAEVNKLTGEWQAQLSRAEAAQLRLKKASTEAAEAAKADQKAMLDRVTGSGVFTDAKTGKGDYRGISVANKLHQHELQNIEKNVAEAESVLKHSYDTQMTLLESLHKNKLISEADYQMRQLAIMQEYEANAKAARDRGRVAELEEFNRRVDELGATAFPSDTEREGAYKKLVDDYILIMKKWDNADAKLAEDRAKRMKLSADEVAGSIVKLDLEMSEFWKKDAVEAGASVSKITWYISEQDKAMQEAADTANKKYGRELLKLTGTLELAEGRLNDFYKALTGDAVDDIERWSKIASTTEEIEKLKEMIEDFKGNAARASQEAVANAARNADIREFEAMANRITDAITSGASEGLSGIARNLRKVIEQEFVRQWITIPIRAVIGDVIGLSGVGSGTASGSGNALGTVDAAGTWSKTMNSLGSLASNWNGSGLNSLITSASGTGLGLNTVSSVPTQLMGPMPATYTPTATGAALQNLPIGGVITAYSEGGVGGFAAGVGSTALAGGVSSMIGGGSFLGGASTALTSIGPWGWAALAVAALLGMGKGEYVKSWGDASMSFDRYGKTTSSDLKGVDPSHPTSPNVVKGFMASYLQSARDLGIVASNSSFSYGANNSEGGKFRVGSQVGNVKFDSGEIKADDAAMKLAASRAVMSALSGSDLPKHLKGMFDNVDIGTSSQETLDSMMALAKGAKAIHEIAVNFPASILTDASYDTVKALADLSGGIDALQNNVATYYKNFYDNSQIGTLGLRSLTEQFEKIGVGTMPATREAYRALVEKQDLATEEGRQHAAQLYALSGAYAELTPNIAEMNAMLANVGASMYTLDSAGQAAANGLAAAAGGLSNLQSLVGSFQSGYFTEAEQRLMTVNSVTADLNAAGFNFTADQVGGASRADIRAVVTAAGKDINTAEGQKRYIAALKAAQQLDSTLPSLAKAVETASGGGGVGSGGAVNSIKDAWKSIVDSLWNEVRRIRGEIESTGPDAYIAAQARFAMQTAAARAGDQDAAKQLPATSQALLKLAEAQSKTLVEFKLIQGSVMDSLTVTATKLSKQYGFDIPSYDVGTNVVPRDMLAMIHEGEAIVPKAYNPALAGYGSDSGNNNEIASLREELRQLKSIMASVNENTGRFAKRFDDVTQKGKAMITETLV